MGYLVCQNCKGYYKLQPGENPEDFTNTCACGGNLRYAVSIDVVNNKTHFHINQKTNKREHKKERTDEKTRPNKDKEDLIDLLVDFRYNRKLILIVALLITIFGLPSIWFSVVGFITLIIAISLFFTDSWIVYLIIFSLWVFGGIFAFLNSIMSIYSIVLGLYIVIIGVGNMITLAQKRKKNVSGYDDL